MCGGGGPSMPPQPSPREQAEAREWEASQQAARDARAAAERKAEEAARKAEADAKWSTGRSSAFNRALDYGTSRMTSMGMDSTDPYGVGALYRSRVGANNNALQVGDDYTAAFAPTIWDDVVGEVRGGQRNKYTRAFGNEVDPYYAEERFGSTADDAILNAILGRQYDDAFSGIQTARGRGQINQAGYDRAIADLSTARSGANAELQRIGGGVLSGIQSDVNSRRQRGLDSASAWDFGDTFDVGREAGRVKSYADERMSGLEGDITNAIGGKNFFDVNTLLGRAASRAGTETAPTSFGNAGSAGNAGMGALANALSGKKREEGVF